MTRTTASAEADQHLLNGFVPFPHERAERYRQAGYWVGKPLDSILSDAARQWPDRVAAVDPSASHTFAQLDQLASEAAAGFADLGIGTGDRVLLQMPNTADFAIALFGLLRAGAVPVMCLPAHRRAELSHFATVSGAVALVIADRFGGFDYRDMARELVAEHPRLRQVVVDGDAGEFTSWTSLFGHGSAAAPTIDTAEPALLLVSGGTTGAPKLIPRTHDDYYYNATASAALCEMTGDDVYLTVLPAAHNFPLSCPGM
ncbi:AMP-binding protein, partial [Mycolicibacterium mucogenicum]